MQTLITCFARFGEYQRRGK